MMNPKISCSYTLHTILKIGFVALCLAPAGLTQTRYSIADLGTLGGANSRGLGINNSGQITGYADTGGGFYQAFLYGGGGMTDLGTLPYDSYEWRASRTVRSEGFGINNSGQVTGWSLSSLHAFLYSGGSMADLGTLGGFLNIGVGINDSGQVTGYSYTTGNGALHALLWYRIRCIDTARHEARVPARFGSQGLSSAFGTLLAEFSLLE
jgi:probable HAF family extracellular repeat protein